MRRDEPETRPGGTGRPGRTATVAAIVLIAATSLAWATGASGTANASPWQEPSTPAFQTPPDVVPGSTWSFRGGSFELAPGDRASDLFVWAQRAVLHGEVEDNVFVGAQVARLEPEGRIGGDLFVFAQTATIEGKIEGDVYFWCAAVEIAPGAEIAGNLYGGAGELSVAGTVDGALDVHAGHTLLDGTIGSSVDVDCGELEVGPNARIAGDLTYTAGKAAAIDEGAEVAGTVQRREEKEEEGAEEGGWLDVGWWEVGWKAAMFVGSFLIGAFLLWVGGTTSQEPPRRLADSPARGLGLGFVVAVITPVVALIGLLFGIVPGVFGFAVFFVAVYLARLVTSLCLGTWALRRLRPVGDPSPYVGLGVGLVAFYLLTAIPFVGFLLWIAAVIAGLGGLFLALQARRKSAAAATSIEGDAAVEGS